MEKIRNWYKSNILLVFNDIIHQKVKMISTVIAFGLLLFIWNYAQYVCSVSKIIETKASSSYSVHIVCRSVTEDQVKKIIQTQKEYSKHYDGAYKVEYVNSITRKYDTIYDVGLRLVTYPGTFYKNDIIIGYNSFLQNYRDYLISTPGASIEVTPLYYSEARYKLSTFIYYIIEHMSLKSEEDIVQTVLKTEVPYITKPFMGMDENYVSETIVYFFYTFVPLIITGLMIIFVQIFFEIHRTKNQFAVFSIYGADTKRLSSYVTYKMILLMSLLQIPCVLCVYTIGFFVYGKIGFSVSPVLFIRSLTVGAIAIWLISNVVMRFFTHHHTAVGMLAASDIEAFISPPKYVITFEKRISNTFYSVTNIWRFRRFIATVIIMNVFITIMAQGYTKAAKDVMGDTEFQVEFPTYMEYEVFENRFYPEVSSVSNIKVKADITFDGNNNLLRVFIGDDEIEAYRIVVIGEEDQQVSTTFESKKKDIILNLPSKKFAEQIRKNKNIERELKIKKAVDKIGSISDSIPDKHRKELLDSVFAYEEDTYQAYLIEDKNAKIATLQMPFSIYKKLVGKISGAILGRHIMLSDESQEGENLHIVRYKDKNYTNDFQMSCEYIAEKEAAVMGDFSEVLLDTNTVALKCSEKIWNSLGYAIGDSIFISDAGKDKAYHNKLSTNTDLLQQIMQKTFQRRSYRICAVVFSNSNSLEICVNPLVYKKLTGIDIGYSSAEIIVSEDFDDTEELSRKLRVIAGKYYETYIYDNHTLKQNTLKKTYHRQFQKEIAKIAMLLSLDNTILEYCYLFHQKRKNEQLVLHICPLNKYRIAMIEYSTYIPIALLTVMSNVTIWNQMSQTIP